MKIAYKFPFTSNLGHNIKLGRFGSMEEGEILQSENMNLPVRQAEYEYPHKRK